MPSSSAPDSGLRPNTAALTQDAFARLMERLGPFEAAPTLAVGVSGGSDSMALCLLADKWVKDRNGRLIALTVDHALRPDSAQEARQVGEWLNARGIAHEVLRWTDIKPTSGIQEAARDARYRLLSDYCLAHGILHLAVAHTRDDQAETVLLRLAKGSGPDGLAGMAAVREMQHGRLIRPLLGVSREELRAVCMAEQQPWIEDPSNQSDVFARARMRALMPMLVNEGLTTGNLAQTATRCGAARALSDYTLSAVLARTVSIYPEGWAEVDTSALRGLPQEMIQRILARVVSTVGGLDRIPRQDRLERATMEILKPDASARTLGGCLLMPRKNRLIVCREANAITDKPLLYAGKNISWDNRFRIIPHVLSEGKVWVSPLGAEGWKILGKRDVHQRSNPVLPAARNALPAIWDSQGLLCVPHFGWIRDGESCRVDAVFAPKLSLAGSAFAVV